MKTNIKKKIVNGVAKYVLEETLEELPLDNKMKMRHIINDSVFDIHDSVADNAKMISLIFSLLYRIYDALPEEIKTNLDPKDREIIEYAFSKYKDIKTKADIEFQINGTKIIDKLMDRQGKIGDLYIQIYDIQDQEPEIVQSTSSTSNSDTTTTNTDTNSNNTNTNNNDTTTQ